METTASLDRAPRGSRFDSEGDEIVRQMFSPEDLGKSPEEYAARHAHNWGCFALHFYRFRDPVLGAWVKRFGELFENPQELERCRERFLTKREREQVRREAAEEF